MRTIITASFLVSSVLSRTLEEAYGPVVEVDEVKPWAERGLSRRGRSADYFAVRQPGNCTFPLNVVIVQDVTESFEDDIRIMRDTQLKQMVTALSASHPNARFGVVSFRDIPLHPFGTPTDFCHRFVSPLTSDLNELKNAYSSLTVTGGGDPPEDQYGALIAACQSSIPGWSPPDSIATNLIVLSTDAQPHFANDGFNYPGDKALPPYSGNYNDTDPKGQCVKSYYPSPDQVKNALIGREAYLAQLIFDGAEQDYLVTRSWQWFNAYIGQTPDFIEPLANDASNFWSSLSQIIRRIEDTECPAITTVAPTTATTRVLIDTESTISSATTSSAQIVTDPEPTISTGTTTTTRVIVDTEPTSSSATTVTSTVVSESEPVPISATVFPPPFTTGDGAVTQIGSLETETTMVPCSPCSCPNSAEPCPCAMKDGVLIRLAHRPQVILSLTLF